MPSTHPRFVTIQAFFFAAAFALAAFFLLLRIMTMLRNDPTTADPSRMRMTGMRIAHTRGGKKFCSGWSESTKGWCVGASRESASELLVRDDAEWIWVLLLGNGIRKGEGRERTHHQKCPDRVVEKYDRGSHKHGEADEFVKLRQSDQLALERGGTQAS